MVLRLKKEERIEKILQAAAKIFARDGFEHASTKEIASLAECTEALVYKYFRTKKDLLASITAQVFEQNDPRYTSILSKPYSFRDFLDAMFLWQMEKHYGKDADHTKVIHRHEYNDPQFARQVCAIRQEKRIQPLAVFLRYRQEQGEVLANVHCEALSLLVVELFHEMGAKILFLDLAKEEAAKSYKMLFDSIYAQYCTSHNQN